MKRGLTSLVLAIGVFSLFVPSPVMAEEKPEVADIPFAFVVANRTLPAGKYNVSRIKNGTPVFAFRNEQGDSVFVHLGARRQGRFENSSLTFACHGADCVLAKFTPANSSVAYGLGEFSVSAKKAQPPELISLVSIRLKTR